MTTLLTSKRFILKALHFSNTSFFFFNTFYLFFGEGQACYHSFVGGLFFCMTLLISGWMGVNLSYVVGGSMTCHSLHRLHTCSGGDWTQLVLENFYPSCLSRSSPCKLPHFDCYHTKWVCCVLPVIICLLNMPSSAWKHWHNSWKDMFVHALDFQYFLCHSLRVLQGMLLQKCASLENALPQSPFVIKLVFAACWKLIAHILVLFQTLRQIPNT